MQIERDLSRERIVQYTFLPATLTKHPTSTFFIRQRLTFWTKFNLANAKWKVRVALSPHPKTITEAQRLVLFENQKSQRECKVESSKYFIKLCEIGCTTTDRYVKCQVSKLHHPLKTKNCELIQTHRTERNLIAHKADLLIPFLTVLRNDNIFYFYNN